MGIRDLWPFLRRRKASLFTAVPPRALRGRRVAVDGGDLLYHGMHACGTPAGPVLQRWFEDRLGSLAARGADLTVVLDGAGLAAAKRAERGRRADVRARTAGRAHARGDHAAAARAALAPSGATIDALCRACAVVHGVRVVQAPHEAEAEAARRTRTAVPADRVDAVLTRDGDALAFGAREVLLRQNGTEELLRVRLVEVLRALDLRTEAQFVDFCVLCGSDFCPRIPKVGPVGALALLHAHGSLAAAWERELGAWPAARTEAFRTEAPRARGIFWSPRRWSPADVAVLRATKAHFRWTTSRSFGSCPSSPRASSASALRDTRPARPPRARSISPRSERA